MCKPPGPPPGRQRRGPAAKEIRGAVKALRARIAPEET
jgi:hypothetical protein